MLTITIDPSLAAIAGDTAKVFDEAVSLIRFGRAMDCEVRFSASDDRLGRNHFELRRVAGGYNLLTDRQHPVFINGVRVVGDVAITDETELHLVDAAGPSIRLSFSEDAKGLITNPHFKSDGGTVQGTLGILKKSVAVLALAAIVGASAMGWQAHRQNQIEQSFLNETAALHQKMATTPTMADWAQIYARIKPSVYQVALMANDGSAPQVMGTAFVNGPHSVISNAHVAALLSQRANNQKLVLLSSDQTQTPITIVDVKIHPAYQAFKDVVAETTKITGHEINPQGSYDVAELFVDPSATLAPPLLIAPPDKLNAMRVGDAMAYVGYPANFAVNKSVQQLRIGYVSGATDFMGTSQAQGGQLIYHTAPAEGGTSGSPIVNEQGEVIAVHSGGERRFLGEAQVVSGSGTFYAQSASLIGDIENGWTDAKLKSATREWQNDALFLARRNELWALLQTYKDSGSFDRFDTPPSFEAQAKLSVGQTRSTDGETILKWSAKSPGTYMAFVLPEKNEKLNMRLKTGDVVLQSPIYVDAAPMAVFKIDDIAEITFAISGKPNQNYWLQVIKLQDHSKRAQ